MLEARSYQQIKKDHSTTQVQLIIVTGLLVLAWLFSLPGIAYVAGLVGLICLVIPPAGYAVVWSWYKLAEMLGFINAHVLLSLVYYLIATPTALLFRLSGNDPLKLKKPKYTVFNERNYTYQPGDIKNPW